MTTIKGTKGNDYLSGTAEIETIKGGKGRDILDWQGGADILYGGKGRDTFVIHSNPDDSCAIADFQPGKDLIVFDIPDGMTFVYVEEPGYIGYGPNNTAIDAVALPALIHNHPALGPTDLLVI